MDTGTITLIAGIISCVIGVSTFVSGRLQKAEQNGSMETKINQALDGIASINRKIEDFSKTQHTIDLVVNSHEEQIRTIFRNMDDLKTLINEGNETKLYLAELLRYFKEGGASD